MQVDLLHNQNPEATAHGYRPGDPLLWAFSFDVEEPERGVPTNKLLKRIQQAFGDNASKLPGKRSIPGDLVEHVQQYLEEVPRHPKTGTRLLDVGDVIVFYQGDLVGGERLGAYSVGSKAGKFVSLGLGPTQHLPILLVSSDDVKELTRAVKSAVANRNKIDLWSDYRIEFLNRVSQMSVDVTRLEIFQHWLDNLGLTFDEVGYAPSDTEVEDVTRALLDGLPLNKNASKVLQPAQVRELEIRNLLAALSSSSEMNPIGLRASLALERAMKWSEKLSEAELNSRS